MMQIGPRRVAVIDQGCPLRGVPLYVHSSIHNNILYYYYAYFYQFSGEKHWNNGNKGVAPMLPTGI